MNNIFNINAIVRVKLSKSGAAAFNSHNSKLIEQYLMVFPGADCNFLKTDYKEGDIVENSLWYVFSMLDDYFIGNTIAPFINNEIEFLD